MEEVIENGKDLYETRNKIINILEGIESKVKKSKFHWLHRPKAELEELIKRIKDDDDLDRDERIVTMKKNLLSF